MKRVLIISYYFPPVNIVASRRYGDMAPYMEKFGWEPIVVTTRSVGDLPVRLPPQNIIRIGENCDSGKTVVAAEAYRGIPFLAKPFYFLYHTMDMDIISIDRFVFSWRSEVLAKKRMIKAKKPHVIIATHQPAVSLWLGRALAKELSLPWVADLRDAVSLCNNSRFGMAKWVDSFIDKRIMQSASRITTISPTLASLMADFYEKPVDVIYNGFEGKAASADVPLSKKANRFILYYAGRFHPHRVPGAKLVIDWLATHAFPQAVFRARSLGPREANEEILDYARKKGVGKAVELLPFASAGTIFKEEQEADVLLVCEDVTKMNSLSHTNMTGKLFEYLPFQAPIAAITRADSDIRLVLEDTGRGFVASNMQEFADGVEKASKGFSFDRKEDRIAAYSRESQCKALCGILDAVATKHSP